MFTSNSHWCENSRWKIILVGDWRCSNLWYYSKTSSWTKLGLWDFSKFRVITIIWYNLYQQFKSRKLAFRLICNKNIENDGKSCPDFEIRFCCPQNLKQNSSTEYLQHNTSITYSLNYSESDFDEGDFTISYKLIIQ